MPMNRELYPENRKEIALVVKNESNWTCEECGKMYRRPGKRLAAFYKNINEWKAAANKPQSFTLTRANYQDRDPANCTNNDLIALCAPYHLKLDVKRHTQSRKTNQIEQQETAG